MNRRTTHLWVDGSLLVTGVCLLTTGLMLYWVLPQGSRSAAVLGWTRHEWGDIHFWLAMTMLGLLGLHLTLNWNWVCNTVYRTAVPQGAHVPTDRVRCLAGVAVLASAVLLIGSLLWLASNTRQTAEPRHQNQGRQATMITDWQNDVPVGGGYRGGRGNECRNPDW
ncbi:MAG: DUF4405 domain-containing protein [Phycisphaeraceae bacterium]|nr:DUF4405 domain-containing protein [Phycisphaeraceae bacterium]